MTARTKQAAGRLRLEYLPLGELCALKRNPKEHDSEEIGKSFTRFGFVEPIVVDEAAGVILAGHGRVEVLTAARDRGDEPPPRVVAEVGEWLVPVILGVSLASTREREAYAIASNQTSKIGGLREQQAAGTLDGLGFNDDDIALLLGTPDDETTGSDAPSATKRHTCPRCGHEFED